MKKILILGVAAAVLVAGGIVAWLTLGGEDETTARGTCDNRSYELSAETEDGGIEVTFELQSAGPGETWDVVIEQGGTAILSGPRTTDEDGELDVDVFADENGGEEFSVTATPAAPATGDACTASV